MTVFTSLAARVTCQDNYLVVLKSFISRIVVYILFYVYHAFFAYTYSYLWYMHVYILLFMVTYSACSYRPYHATSRQSDLSRQIISQFHVNVSVLNHLYHALLHTFYIICIMPFCVYIFLLVVTYLYVFISMASRGTAAAPVLTHWSCRGLASGLGCSACMIWCVGVWV